MLPVAYRFSGRHCPLRNPSREATDNTLPGIIGLKVLHKTFGEGTVTQIGKTTTKVAFAEREVEFLFPQAFEKHLTCADKESAAEIAKYLRRTEKRPSKQSQKKPPLPSRKKNNSRNNVAFKLNYCNGGKTYKRFGFDGVCSEAVIRYNIEKEHRVWCSNERCDCRRFYDGKISYKNLLKSYPCQESIALRDWRTYAGADANGDPRKICGAVVNKLGIFTTVPPNEKERFIFGAFMIRTIIEGDDNNGGAVHGNRDYCLELTPKEARKVRFWDYYKNPEKPENRQWRSGLVRYFDDDTAVKILQAMLDAKEDKEGKHKARRLLSRYCEANNIAVEQESGKEIDL
ncbi:MAG: hypothetical protein IJ812_06035 [Schwartzia sp.]|nr:hypothetical protein [Schwartzia sp. (in: firmicutes)]MBR1759573.1 hypothetical protein [Schwartzia sp. (in: firmicutes)]MBR1885948.1 hypothetical protein [Schwartzia sp. (in: firmicutes)]